MSWFWSSPSPTSSTKSSDPALTALGYTITDNNGVAVLNINTSGLMGSSNIYGSSSTTQTGTVSVVGNPNGPGLATIYGSNSSTNGSVVIEGTTNPNAQTSSVYLLGGETTTGSNQVYIFGSRTGSGNIAIGQNSDLINLTTVNPATGAITLSSTGVVENTHAINFVAVDGTGYLSYEGTFTNASLFNAKDKKIKALVENKSAQEGLFLLERVNVKRYVNRTNQEKLTFFAEELSALGCSAVSHDKFSDSWGIDPLQMVAHCVKAIQELNLQVQELKKKK